MYLACPSWHPGLLHKGPDWHSGRERERAAGGRLLWWVVTPWCCPARGGGLPRVPGASALEGPCWGSLGGSARTPLPAFQAAVDPDWPSSPACLSSRCHVPAPCGPLGARPSWHGGRPVGTSAPLQTRWAPGAQKAQSVQPLDRALRAPSSRDRGRHSGGDTPREQVPASFTAFVSRLPFPCVSTTHAGNSLPFCPPEKVTPQTTKSRC